MNYERRSKEELVTILRERDKKLAKMRANKQKNDEQIRLIKRKIERVIKMMQSFTRNPYSTKINPQNYKKKKVKQ